MCLCFVALLEMCVFVTLAFFEGALSDSMLASFRLVLVNYVRLQ